MLSIHCSMSKSLEPFDVILELQWLKSSIVNFGDHYFLCVRVFEPSLIMLYKFRVAQITILTS